MTNQTHILNETATGKGLPHRIKAATDPATVAGAIGARPFYLNKEEIMTTARHHIAAMETGTKSNPCKVYEWSAGFDLCRELNRPLYVKTVLPDEDGCVFGKVFPSGHMDPGNSDKATRL